MNRKLNNFLSKNSHVKTYNLLLTLPILVIVLILFASFTTQAYSQQPTSKTIKSKTDTTSQTQSEKKITIDTTANTANISNQINTNSSQTYNISYNLFSDNPVIRLFLAPGKTHYNEDMYPGDYNSTTSLTLELGTVAYKNYPPSLLSTIRTAINSSQTIDTTSSTIQNMTFSGLFFNYQFDKFGKSDAFEPEELIYSPKNKLEKTFSVGLSSLDGASYKSINITLLNGISTGWTKLDLKHYPQKDLTSTPNELISVEPRIADGIRFMNKYTAEIDAFKIANTMGLTLAATRSVIYERYLFWKHSGSMIIKSIASGVLNTFLADIRLSSPNIYPVVNFLLNSALDFGFSELQKKKMNWPFNSVPGYIYDEFRVGLNFEF